MNDGNTNDPPGPDIWAEIRPAFELEWVLMLIENDLLREDHAMARWRELVDMVSSPAKA